MGNKQEELANRLWEVEYRVNALYAALDYAYVGGFAKKLEKPATLSSAPAVSAAVFCGPDGYVNALAGKLGYIYDQSSWSWVKVNKKGEK